MRTMLRGGIEAGRELLAASTALEHRRLVDLVAANKVTSTAVASASVLLNNQAHYDYATADDDSPARKLLQLGNDPDFTGVVIVGLFVTVFICIVCVFLVAGFGKQVTEGCATCLVSSCGPNQFTLAIQKYFPVTIRNAKDSNGKTLDVKKNLMEREAKRRGYTMDQLKQKYDNRKKKKKKKVKVKKKKKPKKGKKGKGKKIVPSGGGAGYGKSKMKKKDTFEDQYFKKPKKKHGNDAKWKGGRQAAYA